MPASDPSVRLGDVGGARRVGEADVPLDRAQRVAPAECGRRRTMVGHRPAERIDDHCRAPPGGRPAPDQRDKRGRDLVAHRRAEHVAAGGEGLARERPARSQVTLLVGEGRAPGEQLDRVGVAAAEGRHTRRGPPHRGLQRRRLAGAVAGERHANDADGDGSGRSRLQVQVGPRRPRHPAHPVLPAPDHRRGVGRRPRDEVEADDVSGERADPHRGDHAEVASASAAQRPEQVGVVTGVDLQGPAGRRDHGQRRDRIAGEPVRPSLDADPAAESQTRGPHGRAGPGRQRAPVRFEGLVYVEQPRSGAHQGGP